MEPSDRDQGSVWRGAQVAGLTLVLGLFLWTLRDLLNPFLMFWVLLAALFPFRHLAGHGLWVALAALLTLFWVLAETGFLLAPFVVAIVLAYLLDPIVDRLEARGAGRTVAIGVVALPLVGAAVLMLVLGVPALGRQMADLIDQVPVLLSRSTDWLEALRTRLLRLDFLGDALVRDLRDLDAEAITGFLRERQEMLARRLWGGVLGVGRGLGAVLTVLGYLVLTPVLTFYLLRDYDGIRHRVAELLPEGRRSDIVAFAREYDHLLARYLRGQILVAAIVGSLTALGLFVLGFPYAFLLGVMVAVFGLIPYLGLLLSLLPAVLISLVSGNVLISLGKVALVYGVAQGLEGAVISPRIVGESVGLHPVWVVLALAVSGFFFGFVGLLLAVPAAVAVKLLALRALDRYRASKLYGGAAAAPG